MNDSTNADIPSSVQGEMPACQSIDWYSEGQARSVDVDGVRITIRFVGRRGRRARIAVTAPTGARFDTDDVS